MPRRHLLVIRHYQWFSAVLMIVFDNCWQKSKQKTMSAESASLKIGSTTLKVRNLPSFLYGFKQTDFLRSVSPIFLTLTRQGGNQGILRSASYL